MKKLLNYFFLGIIFWSSVMIAQSSSPTLITVQKRSETDKPVLTTPEKTSRFTVELPEVKREFRGAWVATVANINWPSKRNLSTEEQKSEAIFLLDLLKSTNFNAVIFQVRPSADALYESCYEPWSYFLNGETGKCPLPYYDPLQFWIEEAHNRGMELHVWLNPYRAHHLSGGSVHKEAMVHKASDHIVRLKNGMYWFDPASKQHKTTFPMWYTILFRAMISMPFILTIIFIPTLLTTEEMIFRTITPGISTAIRVGNYPVPIGAEITLINLSSVFIKKLKKKNRM